MSNERTTISGSDGFGEISTYEFKLVDAWTGLSIAYDYTALITLALPKILAAFDAINNGEMTKETGKELGEGRPLLQLTRLVPTILSKDRLQDLCKTFLTGAKVDEVECDAAGMCSLFVGKPHKVIAALFWALAANYPSYILPLLSDGGDDTAGSPSPEKSATR